MQDLDTFVAEFTDATIPYILRKTTCYARGPDPSDKAPLAYTTVRLGEQRRKGFTPSFPLLDMIGETTSKKVIVNEKAAWLFICGKNIVSEGIVEATVKGGPVIVVNEKGEVLGWGVRTRVGVTNKLDRGDYLRRGA